MICNAGSLTRAHSNTEGSLQGLSERTHLEIHCSWMNDSSVSSTLVLYPSSADAQDDLVSLEEWVFVVFLFFFFAEVERYNEVIPK